MIIMGDGVVMLVMLIPIGQYRVHHRVLGVSQLSFKYNDFDLPRGLNLLTILFLALIYAQKKDTNPFGESNSFKTLNLLATQIWTAKLTIASESQKS
jgi:hypothetical protein